MTYIQRDNIYGIQVRELNEFLNDTLVKAYFDVGNLIPIWPGGNKYKGNQNHGFMDIPELFFHKYPIWFDLLKHYPDSFIVNEFIDQVAEVRFETFLKFIESIHSIDSYQEYISYAVRVINERTRLINGLHITE